MVSAILSFLVLVLFGFATPILPHSLVHASHTYFLSQSFSTSPILPHSPHLDSEPALTASSPPCQRFLFARATISPRRLRPVPRNAGRKAWRWFLGRWQGDTGSGAHEQERSEEVSADRRRRFVRKRGRLVEELCCERAQDV